MLAATHLQEGRKLLRLAWFLLGLLFAWGSQMAFAQQPAKGNQPSPTCLLTGKVWDKETQQPLQYAKVCLQGTALCALTDSSGRFRILNIPPGRYVVEAQMMGYATRAVPEQLITAANTTELEIALNLEADTLDAVQITGNLDKSQPMNEMVLVGTRQVSMEEAGRYAGTVNDPGRMVQSFAGVVGGPGLSNEIIVRGNSSAGVLWRIEGLDYPSPNHFSSDGASYGGISVLNSNVLGSFDFHTSNFSAEYGNAYAAIMDVRLRNGYTQRHKGQLQLSTIGLEAVAEGPMNKNAASYLIGYRFSTLALLKMAGLFDLGLPMYQDGSFKFNIPTAKAGTFSIFGMAGYSRISNPAVRDTAEWLRNDFKKVSFTGQNLNALVGVSHSLVIGTKGVLKSALGVNIKTLRDDADTLTNSFDPVPFSRGKYDQYFIQFYSTYTHRFSSKWVLKAGLRERIQLYNIRQQFVYEDTFRTLTEGRGNSALTQVFAEVKWSPVARVSILLGVNALHHSLNNAFSAEPRLSIAWNPKGNHRLTLGSSLHSQTENISYYRVRIATSDSTFSEPNRNLKLLRSWHNLLGYEWQILPDLRLATDVYFQYQFSVPVAALNNRTFSGLNVSEFQFNMPLLVSQGTGMGYGWTFTLEKFFTRKYYLLFTGSVFRNQYRDIDGRVHPTVDDRRFAFNLLGGKEFYLGKNKNHILSLNVRINVTGGVRYTPLNLAESVSQNEAVYDYSRVNTAQAAPFFRPDFRINYSKSGRRGEFYCGLDIQNVANYANFGWVGWDKQERKEVKIFQPGILPNLIIGARL